MDQNSWRNVANKDCQELHEEYSKEWVLGTETLVDSLFKALLSL